MVEIYSITPKNFVILTKLFYKSHAKPPGSQRKKISRFINFVFFASLREK